MLDKVHSSTTFIKYQSEQDVDMNNPDIIPDLRNHPFVVKKIAEGKDLADIFYEFHLKAVNISEEECIKYGISSDDASKIINVIRTFAIEFNNQKQNGTLFDIKQSFPEEAMVYNRK